MRILLCLLLSCFLSDSLLADDKIGEESKSNGDCTTHTVRNEATNVTHTITRCIGEAVSDIPYQQPTPKNTDRNSKQDPNPHWDLINSFDDLAAQESMAWSTKIIKRYTGAGVLLSTIGLVLLGWTINQNRKTFNHIQSASHAELKLHISIEEDESFVKFTSDKTLEGQITFKNYGRTPIIQVLSMNIFECSVITTSHPGLSSEQSAQYKKTAGSAGMGYFTHLATDATRKVTFKFPAVFKSTVERKTSEESFFVFGQMVVSDISTTDETKRHINFTFASGPPVEERRTGIGQDFTSRLSDGEIDERLGIIREFERQEEHSQYIKTHIDRSFPNRSRIVRWYLWLKWKLKAKWTRGLLK